MAYRVEAFSFSKEQTGTCTFGRERNGNPRKSKRWIMRLAITAQERTSLSTPPLRQIMKTAGFSLQSTSTFCSGIFLSSAPESRSTQLLRSQASHRNQETVTTHQQRAQELARYFHHEVGKKPYPTVKGRNLRINGAD
jgi:hypothetical protein